MIAAVDIINRALRRVNASTITGLTDQLKEADVARAEWDIALDASLRAHDWGFARRREPLALMTVKPLGKAFAYAEPGDCVRIVKILPPPAAGADEPSADFAIGNIDNRKAVLCDIENAVAEYTTRVDDPARFDPEFVEALTCRLAATFAVAIKSDGEMAMLFEQLFARRIAAAGVSNARESGFDDDPVSSFERARWS